MTLAAKASVLRAVIPSILGQSFGVVPISKPIVSLTASDCSHTGDSQPTVTPACQMIFPKLLTMHFLLEPCKCE